MEYRTIGIIIGTHGVKGEIKVKPCTDFIQDRFAPGKLVYVNIDKVMQKYEIERVRPHKGVLLVKLAGIDDINQAEAWRGLRMSIGTDQLQALDEDEIYYHDLLHMQVVSTDQRLLGEVVEILEGGSHVIIRVRGEREWLIPYVKAFILQVDREEQRLTVDLLEGM